MASENESSIGSTGSDCCPSMQEIYESYVRNGYVMNREGSQELSKKLETTVAAELEKTDGLIEATVLAVQKTISEVFYEQELYPVGVHEAPMAKERAERRKV